MSIHRYRLKTNAVTKLVNKQIPIGMTATLVGLGVTPEVDWNLDNDAALDDLTFYMDSLGYEFVSSSPTSPRLTVSECWQDPVKDILSTPPGGPANGDRYIVGGSATGAWTGHENKIAQFDSGTTTWMFTIPAEGCKAWVDDENLTYNFDGTNWSSDSTEIVEWDVNQAAHGLAVGNVVRVNGAGAYVKALADSGATLGLLVVVAVAGANDFTVAQCGRFTKAAHGLTIGMYYYLSDAVAGDLVPTEPASPSFSNPIVFAESTNKLVVMAWRPSSSALGGASPRTITSDDTAADNDTVIFVDSSLGPVTLTLAGSLAFKNKQLLIIHTVPTNDLTIDPAGAETINGFDNVTLAGDGVIRSVGTISNGAAYFIT